MKKKLTAALLISALVFSAASCGASSSGRTPVTTAAPSDERGAIEAAPSAGAESEGRSDSAKSDGYREEYIGDSESASYDISYSPDDYSWSDDYSVPESYDERRGSSQARAGLLTGGEWRDNSNFIYWRSLFRQRSDWKELPEYWKLNTTERVFVRVSSSGSPACGLTVKLASGNTLLWQTVTDSRGEAFLFPGIKPSDNHVPDKIIVETAEGKAVTQDIPADYMGSDTAIEISMPEPAAMRTELDLMFMIDTTGSMGDELKYLQTELSSVIDTVKNETGADVQLSVNFYRDKGDSYVVRDFGFTKNISIAIEHLEDQTASGGGDYPEAVTAALTNGIADHDWRSNSEKLMFLVLDAPPHHDESISGLENIIRTAAEKGIRIIPVASSGVDTDTEFLCRSMSIATGGTYTFLTDDSGIGYSHLEPTIGSYTVEKLNDMLVRIINEYFSQEPRQYNTQSPAGQQTNDPGHSSKYRTTWFKTNDYYSGEGSYGTKIIWTEGGLQHFFEDYGYIRELEDFAKDVDFDHNVIAVNIELLTSDSIDMGNDGAVVSIKDGKPVFEYELYIPEYGDDSIAAMFAAAEIPKDMTDDPFTEEQLTAMEKTDSAISDILHETENMSADERADIVEHKLYELAGQGLIYENSIYFNGEMFSFEYRLPGIYASIGGGVQIKPFDTYMN